MKPNKEGLSSQNKRDEIQPWKPEKEVQLFYALSGRRPVGKFVYIDQSINSIFKFFLSYFK